MKTAYSYARVSSKEQQEKKNSIPEQQRRINDYAKNNNISIIQSFTDSSSAFHDENRVNFEKMVEQAIKNKPNYIILDDSSRFARTRNVAIETKQLLRSHGIDILYASESNIDTNTVAGFWYEGIQEIKNEATSREISFHTKKGMTGNLQHRDTETGWCYKNGGKAPYGYKRELLYRGIGSKGKPIYKTIWKINEETAPVVRKIIVELYTNGEKSYNYIRDYLNNNHIPNSNGGLWSTSTISSMLKEDRLQEYAGVAIWNKENNNIVGVKYNPKELWTICENAHPAIITKEELSLALERKNNARNSQYQYNPSSDYLLSGKNFENKFLFTCSECGGHVCGCSSGRKHIKKYACSTNNHRGICACSNNLKIDKDWLEETVINIIEQNYLIKEKINKKIDQLYDELKNRNSIYPLIFTHLDPNVFRNYYFKKMKTHYLLDTSCYAKGSDIVKVIQNRKGGDDNDFASRYLLHYNPENINISDEIRKICSATFPLTTCGFKDVAYKEVIYKYLSGLPYNPILVLVGIRIKVEEIIYNQLPENKKNEFIEIHKTNSKLNFASQYTDVSEVFYILQPVYNDSLHLNDDQGDDAKIKSCSLKLYNIPIKNIIKIIFNF